MKKLNISSQLFLIVAFFVLIASTFYTFITYYACRTTFESDLYKDLFHIATINEQIPDMDINKEFQFKFGYYIKRDNITTASDEQKYLLNEDINEIISDVKNSYEANNYVGSKLQGKYYTNKSKKIYYICQFDPSFNNIEIVFTDNLYVGQKLKPILQSLLLTYFLFMVLTSFVVMMWTTRFVKRINSIQRHILNLPKEKYEISYVDDYCDEIGELSRSVEKMRLEIYHNEKTKQEMLQNISHDFKTPIAVIKSYAEAFQDGMADSNSAEVIINQADILKKKVNRLLQFNSLEYLEKNREFEPVLMNDIINDLVQAYRYKTDIDIELDVDPDIYFYGYKENFVTVVDNILDNAKRYAKTKIKIILKKNRLRIYNDGEHIDVQFLNGVFKPYEKGSKGEFGLGMSIVKRTVDFFGYDLVVANEDVGVSFIVEKREG